MKKSILLTSLLLFLCLLYSCNKTPLMSTTTQAEFNESEDLTLPETTNIQTESETAVPETTCILSPCELITDFNSLQIKMSRITKIPTKTVKGVLYKQLQGGCTDGKYLYFALNDTKSENSHSIIYKVDPITKETVLESVPLQLDHTNDMTFNEKTNQIVVVHNAPNRKRISFLDPETLTVTGTQLIDLQIFSMQYNPVQDKYIVGVSGGQNFAVLDAEFIQTDFFKVESTGYTTQGVDADDEYIYFIQYSENVVVVYDWNGTRIGIWNLPIKTGEPECIMHIGSEFYFGYSGNGIMLYKGILSPID